MVWMGIGSQGQEPNHKGPRGGSIPCWAVASRVLDNGLSQEQVSRADYERWELARAAGVTTPADYEVFQALMRRRLAGEATRDDFINSGLNYPAFEHALDLQSDSWPSPGRNYNLRTSRKASHLADISTRVAA